MNKLKEAQMSFIVDEATKLFFAHRINEVTMGDIAKDLGIGEATLYRYFGKKANIVLMAAEKLSTRVVTEFFQTEDSKSGYERVSDFYNSYLYIFNKDKGYYSFINQFDAYILTEKDMDLKQYGESVDSYKRIFISAFEDGLKDGSIKFDGDVELFYRSSTLALLSLCKKLATEDELIEEDKKYDAVSEIKALIEVFLYRIK